MMMTSIVNSQSFQLLQAKGNSWDAGKLKKTAAERFEALDTNHDGQIDRKEAIASGGLFGKNNFVIDNQSANATDAWAAASGKNQRMSLREFIALGLYSDGTKSAANPNNEMDGIITAEESADVMKELSKTKNNPYLAPKLYNALDANAELFSLSNFIPREQEQVDSVNGEETVFMQDKAQTDKVLQESDMMVRLLQDIIQQLLQQKPPTTPNLYNASGSPQPQYQPAPIFNNNLYAGLPQPASPPMNNPYAGGLPQPQQMAMTPPPSFVRGGF